MRTVTAEELKTILENHKHWLNEDCEGWEGMRADLSNADLHYANLSYADLSNANLRYADLSNANLSDADLRYANFSYAKNVPYIPMVCPEEGKFIGWKKAEVHGEENHYRKVIVKLEIPASAKRSSATSRKCRCDKAKVLKIYNLDGTVAEERECYSSYNNDFVYEVGKTVKVDDFNEDRWNECAQGIHFFINRQEAINY